MVGVSSQHSFLGRTPWVFKRLACHVVSLLLEASCFDPGMGYSEVGASVFGDRETQRWCSVDSTTRDH